LNRRTAESAGGGQNIEVKKVVLFLLKTCAVSAYGGFDIRYSNVKSHKVVHHKGELENRNKLGEQR